MQLDKLHIVTIRHCGSIVTPSKHTVRLTYTSCYFLMPYTSCYFLMQPNDYKERVGSAMLESGSKISDMQPSEAAEEFLKHVGAIRYYGKHLFLARVSPVC